MNALCDAHPNAFIGHSTKVNQRLDLAFDMLMRTVGPCSPSILYMIVCKTICEEYAT